MVTMVMVIVAVACRGMLRAPPRPGQADRSHGLTPRHANLQGVHFVTNVRSR
jgi:hypothetical protein